MTDFGKIVEDYHTTEAADNVVRESEFLPHITYSEVVDYGRITIQAEIQGTANIRSFEKTPVEWTRFIEDNSNDQEILRLAQTLQKELQEKFDEEVIPELEYELSVEIDKDFVDYCSGLEDEDGEEYEPEETQISEVILTVSSFSFPVEDLIAERLEQREEMGMSDFDLIEAHYLFSDSEAIENDMEHFGFKLDRTMVDEHLEVYGKTDVLKVEDTVRNTSLWDQFIKFKGSDQEIYKEAEKLQEELKTIYKDDVLSSQQYELNDMLNHSFQKFVQKEYDVEVDEYSIFCFIEINENSYNPEDLVVAREEALVNK